MPLSADNPEDLKPQSNGKQAMVDKVYVEELQRNLEEQLLESPHGYS